MEKALRLQEEIKKIFGDSPVELVGGSVRDIVLNKEPKDWDYCTPLEPDEIEEAIRKAGRKPYLIGKKFGTVGFKVELYNDNPIVREYSRFVYVEVTSYRTEIYTSKSRNPQVEFITSLDDDLARRDLTINSMVLKPDGSIYDPHGGRLDILDRLIKTVGKPKDRIQEDPLRMLRAARFASQLDFKVDPNLIGKMRQLAYTITYVSKERWVQELDKLLVGQNPGKGIQVLMDSELMKYILPEVYLGLSMVGVESVVEEIKEADTIDKKWKALFFYSGFPYTEKESRGRLIYPGHEVVRKELLIGACGRLKFSNQRRDELLG